MEKAGVAVDKLVKEETFSSIYVGMNPDIGNNDPEQVKDKIRQLLQLGA